MGDPKGFMKYSREGPKRKPVELRVLDWKEMYEPISEDKLKIHTLEADGTLKARLEVAVPDGITALAACSPGTASMAPIIVGTRARLWVIR